MVASFSFIPYSVESSSEPPTCRLITHDDATCTEAEVDYFIDLVGHVFPDFPIDRSHIVYQYSGVRPLPAAGDLTPGMVSRDYRVVSSTLPNGTPLISLVGGKWTTFRALGEHITNDVLALLDRSRTASTAHLPIGGGKDFPTKPGERRRWIVANQGDHHADRVDVLLSRYGTQALTFLANEKPHEAELAAVLGYPHSDIVTLTTQETGMRLEDLVSRRTSLRFTGTLTDDGARELAAIVGGELGWSQENIAAEAQQVTTKLTKT